MIEINFSPFPALQTARLTLRKLTVNDVDQVFALRTSPEVMQHIDRPMHADKEASLAWVKDRISDVEENRSIQWAITLKGDTALIGTMCLWNIRPATAEAELGYELLPQYWDKGYMQEVLSAVLKYGFETLHLAAIDAYTEPPNIASVKLLQRNGFVQTGKDPESNNVIFVLRNTGE